MSGEVGSTDSPPIQTPSVGGAVPSGALAIVDVLGKYQRLPMTELKKLSRKKKLELLRELRVRPLRAPQLTAFCAAELLHDKAAELGDDRWWVAEQGLIANLECGDHNGALRLFRQLQDKFGKRSIRVRKLAGLVYEAAGAFDKARRVYEDILGDSPAEPFVAKRYSAMEKSQGNYMKAIDALERLPIYADVAVPEGQQPELFSYAQLHRGTDEAVYRELLYLNYMELRFEQALFYSEEVIMLDPRSYLNFLRHAELLYMMGQLERSATAYAQSLRMNDRENSARAVFGLWLCSLDLLKRGERKSKEETGVVLADARTLHAFAVSKLKSLYTGSPQAPKLALQLQRYH